MLHRLHCSPLLRSRLGLGSPNYIKCNSQIGTYSHMVWKGKIQNFWSEAKEEVPTLIRNDLQLAPFQCFLAAKLDKVRDKYNAKLTGIILWIARKTILKLWLSKDNPTVEDWYKEVPRIRPLEKLTYTLHDNTERFLKIWWPVLDNVDIIVTFKSGHCSKDSVVFQSI